MKIIIALLFVVAGGYFSLYVAGLSVGLPPTRQEAVNKLGVALLNFRLQNQFPPGTPVEEVANALRSSGFTVSFGNDGGGGHYGPFEAGKCSFYSVRWESNDSSHVDSIVGSRGGCHPGDRQL